MPLRPNMGIYTQPISFIGLPVVAVPVPLKPLPIGVQIIAAPWREDIALRIAHALEHTRRAARRRSRELPEDNMDIDLPEVVAEVKQAFNRYEKALVANDIAALNALFRDDRAHRPLRRDGKSLWLCRDQVVPRRALAGRRSAAPSRTRLSPPSAAISPSPRRCYQRPSAPGKVGRQMQTWVKFAEGWRVVAAHVSLIDKPADR